MKARLAFASLAALAWSPTAGAQELTHAVNGAGSGTVGPLAAAPPVPVPTDIRADGGRLGLGTRVTQTGNVHSIDGGTRAGGNLFHSFSRFDLGNGDLARWVHGEGDPGGVRFVINRVTGGDPSRIFGTIDSTALPNAEFFFINPAGIVFGHSARLNVPAAAHFSTAHELRFASGPAFTMTTPGGSSLSIAAPAAFGFIGGQGAILVDRVGFDFLNPELDLSLVAGDIAFTSSEFLANGLRAVAAGAADASVSTSPAALPVLGGSIRLDHSVIRQTGTALQRPRGIRLAAGNVSLSQSNLGTDFKQGELSGLSGPIAIRGGDIAIETSLISASSFGAEPAGDILIEGRNVSIASRSSVETETRARSTGTPGSVRIAAAGRVLVSGDSRVSTSTLSGTSGGEILITGDEIEVADGSAVRSETFAGGAAGSVTLRGRILDVSGGSKISSSTDADGDAGSVLLQISQRARLIGGRLESNTRFGRGHAGLVMIETGTLELSQGAGISTETAGAGNGGVIAIEAGHLLLDSGATIASRAVRGSTGHAGLVLIGGGSVRITGGSTISSDTHSTGNGGGILIEAREIQLVDGGMISSDSDPGCEDCAGGAAGGVSLKADLIRLQDRDEFDGIATGISSDAGGAGDAGSINIEANRLEVLGLALISSRTNGAGAAGTIEIKAADAFLSGTGLSTTTSHTGRGGTIDIDAGRLELDATRIFSQTFGSGDGGSIRVNAGTLIMSNDSELNTTSFRSGDAGSISVTASRMTLDASGIYAIALESGRGGDIGIVGGDIVLGGGSTISAEALPNLLAQQPGGAGNISIEARSLVLRGLPPLDGISREAEITSSVTGQAAAGAITIKAGSMLLERGVISSDTDGQGPAGMIDIDVTDLTLSEGSRINTGTGRFCIQCPPISGDAGEIRILAAGRVELGGGSEITSNGNSGSGDAGRISLTAEALRLERGRISTSTGPNSTGRSGAIAIATGTLEMVEAGSIETISRNAREAGGIMIEAGSLILSGRLSRISSSNEFAGLGDAGSIFISAGMLSLLEGAQLTSSSVAGAAGAIEILMPGTSLLRLESAGPPSMINTSSGPGLGGRIFISRPRAIISNGGSILALGQQGGANVEILSQYLINSSDRTNQVEVSGSLLLESVAYDVSAGTVNRDLSVIDASGVLRGQCAAVRATGQVSQLVVRPIGPYGSRPAAEVPAARPLLAAGQLPESCS